MGYWFDRGGARTSVGVRKMGVEALPLTNQSQFLYCFG